MSGTETESPTLLQWMRDRIDAGSLSGPGTGQMIFVRDRLASLAVPPGAPLDEQLDLRGAAVRVIATHTSKSQTLPVYELTVPYEYDGDQHVLTFTMRDNFYGWVVSVHSTMLFSTDDLVSLPQNVFSVDEHDYMKEDTPARQRDWPVGAFAPYYAEGFPPERCYQRPVRHQFGTSFTCRIWDRYVLYMFVAILVHVVRTP